MTFNRMTPAFRSFQFPNFIQCRRLRCRRQIHHCQSVVRPRLRILRPDNPLLHPRSYFVDALPTILLPPLVFAGLLSALWVYKCCMMVLFQNKIIYMPFIPPFARREKIDDYAAQCRPITWREVRIKTQDCTDIALCVSSSIGVESRVGILAKPRIHVVIIYFQGNASSLPPRLPMLSDTLRLLAQQVKDARTDAPTMYTIVALSYRGYWTSRGRPTQHGIEKDADATLRWAYQYFKITADQLRFVLWGQSIGAGVATGLAARSFLMRKTETLPITIDGLILETPFTSLKDLLIALYPQKWLPYRYLGVFLRSHWDNKAALRQISSLIQAAEANPTLPMILIVEAGQDEIVPPENGLQISELCHTLGFNVSQRTVPAALHSDVMFRSEGRRAVVDFLLKLPSRV